MCTVQRANSSAVGQMAFQRSRAGEEDRFKEADRVDAELGVSSRVAKKVLNSCGLQARWKRRGAALGTVWESGLTASTMLRSGCGHAVDEHQSTIAKLN